MGWWKITGTENIIGDEPLDTLGTAIAAIVSEYQTALGRRPSKAEWEALLAATLRAEESEDDVLAGDKLHKQ